MLLRPYARQQVDHEAKHVECEHEGDDPLEDGCYIPVVCEGGGHEDDGEDDLDEYENEFDPERDG